MTTISLENATPTPVTKIPIYSGRLWVSIVFALMMIMGLSMLKDWWLKGDEPDIWFNISVPVVDMVGSAAVMFIFARIFQLIPKFLKLLAITIGVAIIMQTLEIITKLVYYKVWKYHGWLYLLFVILLWFILTVFALVRLTELKWGIALLITVFWVSWEFNNWRSLHGNHWFRISRLMTRSLL